MTVLSFLKLYSSIRAHTTTCNHNLPPAQLINISRYFRLTSASSTVLVKYVPPPLVTGPSYIFSSPCFTS